MAASITRHGLRRIKGLKGIWLWGSSISSAVFSSVALDSMSTMPNNHPVSAKDKYKWLQKLAPVFAVAGDDIKIIHQPVDFYETLKEEISNAKERIVISSLYLGTGQKEQDLVDVLQRTMQKNPDVKLRILLDCTRGSRGSNNSRTMLLPLVKEFGPRAQVSLYHTPDLRGTMRSVLPERWNEIIGVQHMKVYIADNNIIISGANLSDIYFDQRQDRYALLQDMPQLVDFFEKLVGAVSSFSFQLSPDDEISMNENWRSHPYLDRDNGIQFKEDARKVIEDLIKENVNGKPTVCHGRSGSKQIDTWIYPIIQMGPFGINVDEEATSEFFRRADNTCTISLASGYFNLTDHYRNFIVQNSEANFDILMAHPEANGFYNASGPAGGIPGAYTLVARQFFNHVNRDHQEDRIKLFEYRRQGWTFHAKGIWCYLYKQPYPSLTFIGSPNYGYRSVYRDLEAQIAIATDNNNLQRQLHKERENLYKWTEPVAERTFHTQDRIVPMWVKFVTSYVRNFF